jgi:hypothetical protein
VRGEIARTAVGFRLDDAAGGLALGRAMDQDLADAFARDGEDGAGVKVAAEFQATTSRTNCVFRRRIANGWQGPPACLCSRFMRRRLGCDMYNSCRRRRI